MCVCWTPADDFEGLGLMALYPQAQQLFNERIVNNANTKTARSSFSFWWLGIHTIGWRRKQIWQLPYLSPPTPGMGWYSQLVQLPLTPRTRWLVPYHKELTSYFFIWISALCKGLWFHTVSNRPARLVFGEIQKSIHSLLLWFKQWDHNIFGHLELGGWISRTSR